MWFNQWSVFLAEEEERASNGESSGKGGSPGAEESKENEESSGDNENMGKGREGALTTSGSDLTFVNSGVIFAYMAVVLA